MVALVTGSTSGLGREVALRLADRGMDVIVHGRNSEQGEALVGEIAKNGGSAYFYSADFGRFAEVRRFAEVVMHDHKSLNLLVNNAGIALSGRPRQVSAAGCEMHFHVNYLSHFLLTGLLLPLLTKNAPARIVNVASAAQTPIDFDDPQIEKNYSTSRAYAQSKLAQITFTKTLAARLDGTGIVACSLHPATYMNTPMVRGSGIAPISTVEEGADAVMQLATAEGIENGAYFDGLSPARANAQAFDKNAGERLWELSRKLTSAAD